MPDEILSNVIDILEKEDVHAPQPLYEVNQTLRTAALSAPGNAQRQAQRQALRQAVAQTMDDLQNRFAEAWEMPPGLVSAFQENSQPILFLRSDEVRKAEFQIGTLMQCLLERSAFLPTNGIDTLLGSRINTLIGSNRSSEWQRFLRLPRAPVEPSDLWRSIRLRHFTSCFANIRPADRQTLSPSMDTFIARISEHPKSPENRNYRDDPRDLWPMMGNILQNMSCLTDTQATSIIDRFFQLSDSARTSILNNHLFDMEKLNNTKRQRLIDFYCEKLGRTSGIYHSDNALASIATHPSATTREAMHQRVFSIAGTPDTTVFHAFARAARASARSVRQLWDHLTTLPAPADAPANHDPLRLVRDGTYLGRLLAIGISYGRPAMAPTFADLATAMQLPPNEIAQVFNGGPLSNTALDRNTPLMAAIGTGSLNQMNEWKQAVLSLGLPRDTRQRLLAQRAFNGDQVRTALAYLRSQEADYIAVPALAAYRNIERDFDLDPEP